MFDTLRIGDYVRWTKSLFDNWYMLDDAPMWEDEPKCAMEVTGLDTRSEDACVELACVNGCAGHYVTSMTRDDYEHAVLILGAELLEHVNFSELAAVIGPDQNKYDFEADAEDIFERIQNGSLF